MHTLVIFLLRLYCVHFSDRVAAKQLIGNSSTSLKAAPIYVVSLLDRSQNILFVSRFSHSSCSFSPDLILLSEAKTRIRIRRNKIEYNPGLSP